VYLHKAVRAAEVTIRALFRRLAERLADGRAPEGTPTAVVDAFRGTAISTDAYLDLDDPRLETALWHFSRGDDPVLAQLATALRERKLFKSVKLRDRPDCIDEHVRARVDPIVAAAGFDPRYFAAIDRVEVQAYVEDEALLV